MDLITRFRALADLPDHYAQEADRDHVNAVLDALEGSPDETALGQARSAVMASGTGSRARRDLACLLQSLDANEAAAADPTPPESSEASVDASDGSDEEAADEPAEDEDEDEEPTSGAD